jgi:hypothetical protein
LLRIVCLTPDFAVGIASRCAATTPVTRVLRSSRRPGPRRECARNVRTEKTLNFAGSPEFSAEEPG